MKFKKVKNNFAITIVILLFIGCGQVQSQNSKFNKQKWLTNSEYRYEIVKGDSFPNIDSMSYEQIITTLGQPDFQTEDKLSYCFNIKNSDKMKNCEGSFLLIDMNSIPKYRVTIVWVEPSKN